MIKIIEEISYMVVDMSLDFLQLFSSSCPQTDTAQLYNTHPDSCTHMDRTGFEFNLFSMFLKNKNSSHCHLDIIQTLHPI